MAFLENMNFMKVNKYSFSVSVFGSVFSQVDSTLLGIYVDIFCVYEKGLVLSIGKILD